MASKYKRYHPQKWVGVYVYALDELFKGKADLCFVINFKIGKRLVWEKVGKLSEGYSAQVASEIRAERVKAVRHGETVKTAKEIREEKNQKDKTFAEIAETYFEVKGKDLKGFITDYNRFKNYLSPILGNYRVSEINPQHIELVNKAFADRKPATLWNALELVRRIINFGYKTNRAPALPFVIEMPKKDNEVIEYLTPEQTQRFLDTARSWEAKDVANMLLLAFFTGMRRGEMFKLIDEDIDHHMKLIKIRSPKGGKTMSIGMSQLAEGIILEQIEWRNKHYPDSEFIFPGKHGGQRVDCSSVDRFKKAADLPVKFRPFHGLRHHFAVTLANSGKFTLDMISEMLTHKDASFTKKKYAQFLPEALSAASNTAADILMGKVEK